MVATMCLAPPWLRNSHRYTPCQVPRLRRPRLIGIVSELPVRALLAWAGISSSPSKVWRKYGCRSGTMWSRMWARSVCTSGSAFSLMQSPAEVCLMNKLSNPVWGSAGSWLNISWVMRWQPRGWGFSLNSTCFIIKMMRFVCAKLGYILLNTKKGEKEWWRTK